jgi:hypothetical protein
MTFNVANLSSGAYTYTFELWLILSTLYTIAWPSNVKWLDDQAPDLSSTGIYFFAFRRGGNWLGNMQGRWSL